MTALQNGLQRLGTIIVVLSALLLVQIMPVVQDRLAKPTITTMPWSWIYRPQSLQELVELSDLILVGTITDVAAGPQWVGTTTSPEHPTVTADSMLISVAIVNPVKGQINTGDKLTIYRQVNLGENTHTVAETYLFFLRKRLESTDSSDGSHFIFAAEGNYHIVAGQLVWDWARLANDTNSFAAIELDGANLTEILERIESLETDN